MDYKRFVLSYYKNAMQGIHIQRITHSEEAKKPHSHAYFQMYYVLTGSMLHTTQYGEATLGAGDLFLLPPGEVHYISDVKDIELYTFSFLPDIFSAREAFGRLSIGFLRDFPRQFSLCTKAELPSADACLAGDLLSKIYTEFSEKRLAAGEVICAYAQVLIALFARAYADRMPEKSPGDETADRIAHCVTFIKENYADAITAEDMARACAMSKSAFCKAFSLRTGQSFTKFLHSCRIRAALEYMRKGYKITAIYGLVGYNDFSTFFRNFKKITGCSPKTYFAEKQQ